MHIDKESVTYFTCHVARKDCENKGFQYDIVMNKETSDADSYCHALISVLKIQSFSDEQIINAFRDVLNYLEKTRNI